MPKSSYQTGVTVLSDLIQKAIDSCPNTKSCTEEAYCDTVLEAMDGIAEGLKMRKQELQEESEDG